MSLVEKAAAITNEPLKITVTIVSIILSEAAKFNYRCYKVMVPDERPRYNLTSYATQKYSSVSNRRDCFRTVNCPAMHRQLLCICVQTLIRCCYRSMTTCSKAKPASMSCHILF
jgi:hypothetical protein